MSSFVRTVVANEADGTALANSSAATSILPTGAIWTMPANTMDLGTVMEVEAFGKISTTGTPTITFSLYLAGSTWCATQAVTTGSGITNVTWRLKLKIIGRTIGTGTAATAMFAGTLEGVNAATTLVMVPATSPAVSSGFNSTSANTLDLYATWGTSSASNTITLNGYEVRVSNTRD